ncbi:hypothetical protein ACP70R_003040 [Stipagrostis hirtigluma subsp. patula]
MENDGSGDTSGSDDDRRRDGTEQGEGGGSVSGVTEAGSSGNAAAAMWHSVAGANDGKGKDRLSTVSTDKDAENASTEAAGDGMLSSPARLVAAGLGWLLLGFLTGATAAAALLFFMSPGYTATCTVPT